MQIIVNQSFLDDLKSNITFRAQSGDATQRTAQSYNIELENSVKISSDKELENSSGDKFQKVRFFDSQNQVSVNLSQRSVELLKSYFKNGDDFIALDDGSIGLSGRANAYVEGWYKDIAYNRGYIDSDKNGDGSLSGDELLGVRGYTDSWASGYIQKCKDITISFNHAGAQSYITGSELKMLLGKDIELKERSIQEELDYTITSDKNFDGALSIIEEKSGSKSLSKELQDIVSTVVKNVTGKSVDISALTANNPVPSAVSQEIMQKLKKLSGEVGLLDEEEKERLKREFPELAAIIETNGTISKAQLEAMQEKLDSARAEFSEFDRAFRDSAFSLNFQA